MQGGPCLALFSAVLFGLSTPFAKLLIGEIQPFLLAALFYLGSGVGLSLLLLIERIRKVRRHSRLTNKEWFCLLGAIICGGIVAPVLLMFGLSVTTASSASLLLNLEGVMTALIAWFVFKENFDSRVALGMGAIACGGVLLTVGGGNIASVQAGGLLIVLACFFWAIDNNLTRNVSHADALQIAAAKGLVAGINNLGLAYFWNLHFPAAQVAVEAMLIGFLAYGLSLVLFVRALRDLGTARTGAYFSCAPFVGALVSVLLLREAITWQILLSGLFMIGGVWLHLSERHEHLHEHDEVEHEHEHIHDEHHRHEHSPDDPPGEPHTHKHRHERLVHTHGHFPDLHHRHNHD